MGCVERIRWVYIYGTDDRVLQFREAGWPKDKWENVEDTVMDMEDFEKWEEEQWKSQIA